MKRSIHRKAAVRTRAGMTMFELLVVVTLLMVFAAFFFFSSRHLVVTTKISRVKEEHKVLVRALQNYQMDYMDFPTNVQGLASLNGPTAYLAALPRDPFMSSPEMIYYYRYNPGGGYSYIIVSAGPDGDIDFTDYLSQISLLPSTPTSEKHEPDSSLVDALFNKYLTTRIYDPTNGLNSDGDVITLSFR
jgi:type II secretory pathway pseudopilin PulG